VIPTEYAWTCAGGTR